MRNLIIWIHHKELMNRELMLIHNRLMRHQYRLLLLIIYTIFSLIFCKFAISRTIFYSSHNSKTWRWRTYENFLHVLILIKLRPNKTDFTVHIILSLIMNSHILWNNLILRGKQVRSIPININFPFIMLITIGYRASWIGFLIISLIMNMRGV